MRFYRIKLRLSWTDHESNVNVLRNMGSKECLSKEISGMQNESVNRDVGTQTLKKKNSRENQRVTYYLV